MNEIEFICLSETALLLSFGSNINEHVHEQLMQAKHYIEQNSFKGFVEAVPAYNSLVIYYNPLEIEKENNGLTIQATVTDSIKELLKNLKPETLNLHPSLIEIPICYDEIYGIDLQELSNALKISVQEIIQLHSSKTYKVYMLGFTPGFAYMGTVVEKIVTKRKKQPRSKVEKGSVAIAGDQTGIYPLETPGGWNIIGRTPLQLFDKTKEHPFLLNSGNEVKFISITKEEFNNCTIK